jgi:hypothetical protein
MDNEDYETDYGPVHVQVHDIGWQRAPWARAGDPDVFGYRVTLTLGREHDDVEYIAKAYGSIADAGEGRKDFAGIAEMVADELVSHYCDPDEFEMLMVEGYRTEPSRDILDEFRRTADAIERLRDADPISQALYEWCDGESLEDKAAS